MPASETVTSGTFGRESIMTGASGPPGEAVSVAPPPSGCGASVGEPTRAHAATATAKARAAAMATLSGGGRRRGDIPVLAVSGRGHHGSDEGEFPRRPSVETLPAGLRGRKKRVRNESGRNRSA